VKRSNETREVRFLLTSIVMPFFRASLSEGGFRSFCLLEAGPFCWGTAPTLEELQYFMVCGHSRTTGGKGEGRCDGRSGRFVGELRDLLLRMRQTTRRINSSQENPESSMIRRNQYEFLRVRFYVRDFCIVLSPHIGGFALAKRVSNPLWRSARAKNEKEA